MADLATQATALNLVGETKTPVSVLPDYFFYNEKQRNEVIEN